MEDVTKDEVKRDIKQYKSIFALAEQDGGKLLVKNLRRDVLNDLEILLSYAYEGTEIQLRTAVIGLKKDLDLLRTFVRAKDFMKIAVDKLAEIEKEE